MTETDPDLSFRLKDRNGAEHAYQIHPHPGREGLRIVSDLVGLAAGPLAATIGGALSVGDFGSMADLLRANPAELLARLDVGKIAAELRAGFAALPLERLYVAILSHTTRDGRDLSDPLAFDQAFGRNFGELHVAAWKVANANGFFALPVT